MGRQLQLAVTAGDALSLVNFIHQRDRCRLFISHAAGPDDLWLDDWDALDFGDAFSVYIWPTSFCWQPVYAQTGGLRCPPKNRGRWYISNRSSAPVLEFSGSNLVANQTCADEFRPRLRPRPIRFGRIYWAGDYTAPDILSYDSAAFTKLVDRLWRWVRKMGNKHPDDANRSYFLPEAWTLVAG